MGRKCFIPGCKSGYDSCKEVVSLFKGPRNKDLLQKWRRAIPRIDRQLTEKDTVCSKHFEPHLIITEWVAEHNGHVLMRVPIQAKLAEGAVPTLFPTVPTYVPRVITPPPPVEKNLNPSPPVIKETVEKPKNNKINKINQVEKRIEIIFDQESGLELTRETFVSNFETNKVESPKKNETGEKSDAKEMEIVTDDNNEENNNINTELTLSDISVQFKPTATNWKLKYETQRDLLTIYFVGMTKTGLTYVQKQVVVSNDLCYKIFFLKMKMNEDDCFLDRDNIINDLQDIVNDVDSIRFCNGGPDRREFKNVCPKIAYVDESGVWRHKKCTVECIQPSVTCTYCKRLRGTLRSHIIRRKRGKGEENNKKKKLSILLNEKEDSDDDDDEESSYDSDETLLLSDCA